MPKFMDETNIKITRYSHGLFWVDVWEDSQDGEPCFWAAIQKKDCSIHEDMFGIPVKQSYRNEVVSLDDFLEMVENNLPKYEASYCEMMREMCDIED